MAARFKLGDRITLARPHKREGWYGMERFVGCEFEVVEEAYSVGEEGLCYTVRPVKPSGLGAMYSIYESMVDPVRNWHQHPDGDVFRIVNDTGHAYLASFPKGEAPGAAALLAMLFPGESINIGRDVGSQVEARVGRGQVVVLNVTEARDAKV